MIEKTKANGHYQPLETAPKTGKAIRLCLSDGYGTYGFEPAAWDKNKGWISAKTGKEILVKVVGWRHLKDRGDMDYAAQKTEDRVAKIG